MKYIKLYEDIKYTLSDISNLNRDSLISELNKELSKNNNRCDISYVMDLIEWGRFDINDNLIDDYTTTILNKASKIGQVDLVVELLKIPEINPNTIDKNYMSALVCAIKNDYNNIVKILLNHPDVNPNIQGLNSNYTPLMYACLVENVDAVISILQHIDTNPNVKNTWQQTALMIASEIGFSDIVKELLKHPQIDKEIKDGVGYTAWDHAKLYVQRENPELNPEYETEL